MSGFFFIISAIPHCDGAVHVIGDSMTPELKAGDIVLFKTVPNRRGGLYFGHIYLLVYDEDGDQHVVIKYVEQSKTPGHYKLISTNPKYPPKDVLIDRVRKMAIIKACIRSYEEE